MPAVAPVTSAVDIGPTCQQRPTDGRSGRAAGSGDGGELPLPRALLLGALLAAVLAQTLVGQAEGQRPDGEGDRVDLRPDVVADLEGVEQRAQVGDDDQSA